MKGKQNWWILRTYSIIQKFIEHIKDSDHSLVQWWMPLIPVCQRRQSQVWLYVESSDQPGTYSVGGVGKGEDRSHTPLFRNVKCIFLIEIKAKENKILHLLRDYNKEYGLMYLMNLSLFLTNHNSKNWRYKIWRHLFTNSKWTIMIPYDTNSLVYIWLGPWFNLTVENGKVICWRSNTLAELTGYYRVRERHLHTLRNYNI